MQKVTFFDASHLLLWSVHSLKPYFFNQFPGFAHNNILISMMKDLCSSYLCAFQQRTYFPTMQIYGSPVLNPLSSLVKLISICNKGHCVMGWRERPTDDAQNDFLCNFPTQISRSIKESILIGNCHKSNYQDFSSTLCSIMDWFMTIMSIREFLVRNSLLYARLSLQLVYW